MNESRNQCSEDVGHRTRILNNLPSGKLSEVTGSWVCNVVKGKTFTIGENGATDIRPLLSLLNHSCKPNAVVTPLGVVTVLIKVRNQRKRKVSETFLIFIFYPYPEPPANPNPGALK